MNKRICNKSAFIFVLFFIGQASSLLSVELKPCGTEWINIHKNNNELIGIHVQKLPDDIKDREKYRGLHPVMIIYIFKGNRAHTITYTPTGQVQNGIWWDITEDHWARNKIEKNYKKDVECVFWMEK